MWDSRPTALLGYPRGHRIDPETRCQTSAHRAPNECIDTLPRTRASHEPIWPPPRHETWEITWVLFNAQAACVFSCSASKGLKGRQRETQYSDGNKIVVDSLVASVIIQIFVPFFNVYAESRRQPCCRLSAFSRMSSGESSPQSPSRCRCRNASGDSPDASNASKAPGVATICPGWNFISSPRS